MKIRLSFSDFYPGFPSTNNRLWNALAQEHEPVLVGMDEKPDLLVFGDYGTQHWAFYGLKAYLTGENMLPDFDQCDLAFTPAEIPGDSRAVRFPYYAHVLTLDSLIRSERYDARHYLARDRFCSFVVSNARSWPRNRFFRKLNRRRRVDSAGAHFNNMGSRVQDKQRFLRDYRFNIAFENTASPGYITEKLLEPLLVGTIPIYWGAPDVDRDFDLRCMIHARDFSSFAELADYVLHVDADEQKRLAYLQAPVFKNNQLPDCMSHQHIAAPVLNLLANAKPGVRKLRVRRVREHIKSQRSWVENKWEIFGCKAEGLLWKLGWRY